MTDRQARSGAVTNRRSLIGVIGVAVLVALAVACSGADETSRPVVDDLPVDADDTGSDDASADESEADEPETGESDADRPTDDEPDADQPTDDETTEEPETDEPTDDTPPPAEDASTDEVEPSPGEPRRKVDPVVVALTVTGFIVLVGVAIWWMLRRDDPDAEIGHADRHDWPDDQMSM